MDNLSSSGSGEQTKTPVSGNAAESQVTDHEAESSKEHGEMEHQAAAAPPRTAPAMGPLRPSDVDFMPQVCCAAFLCFCACVAVRFRPMCLWPGFPAAV